MLNELQLTRLEIAMKSLTNTSEWFTIRQFFTGEASEDYPDFDNLRAVCTGYFQKFIYQEQQAALFRYGKAATP